MLQTPSRVGSGGNPCHFIRYIFTLCGDMRQEDFGKKKAFRLAPVSDAMRGKEWVLGAAKFYISLIEPLGK